MYQLKFGCLWAVLSDNELSPECMRYTSEQNIVVSKNDAGGKWETTDRIILVWPILIPSSEKKDL